jgi:hypothetical protein
MSTLVFTFEESDSRDKVIQRFAKLWGPDACTTGPALFQLTLSLEKCNEPEKAKEIAKLYAGKIKSP